MANKKIKLYYHKTDGGAEYLTNTYINCEINGKKWKEGTFRPNTKYIVRIDKDITKDAELTIKNNQLKPLLKNDTSKI
jgi:hypothetical protein